MALGPPKIYGLRHFKCFLFDGLAVGEGVLNIFLTGFLVFVPRDTRSKTLDFVFSETE